MKKLILLLLFVPMLLNAQAGRYSDIALTNLNGYAKIASGATIKVCTSTGTFAVCSSPTATLYTNAGAGTVSANPFTADNNGNFGFWAVPGWYNVTISGTGLTAYTLQVYVPILLSTDNVFTGNNTFTGTNTFTGVFSASLPKRLGNTRFASQWSSIQAAVADGCDGTTPCVIMVSGAPITASGSVALPSNTSVIDEGFRTGTVKLANGVNNGYVFTNSDPVGGNVNINLIGFVIDGNMANQSPSGAQRTGCVTFTKVTGFTIAGIECKNAYNHGIQILDGSSIGTIDNNYVHDNTNGTGIIVGTGTLSLGISKIHIENNTVDSTVGGNCIFTVGNSTSNYKADDLTIANNIVTNCGDVAIEAGVGTINESVTGNTIKLSKPGKSGILVRGASNIAVQGNSCIGSAATITTFSITSNIVTFTSANTFIVGDTVTITGLTTGTYLNTLPPSSLTVLTASSSQFTVSFVHADVGSTTDAGVAGPTNQDCYFVWGNTPTDGTTATNNIISGNTSKNVGRYALNVSASNSGDVNGLTLAPNQFSGSGVANSLISVNATNVHYTGLDGVYSDPTTFLVTTAGALSNPEVKRNGGPGFNLLDTGIAVDTGGLWRWVTSAGAFLLNMNTAAAGDFTTSFTAFQIDTAGKVLIPQNDFQVGSGGKLTVNTSGLLTKYNDIATAGNGAPIERAVVDLTAQTAAVGTTTLYTAPSNGQYRISWDAKVTTVAGVSSTLGGLTIVYTDPDGVAQTITAGALTAAGAVATSSAGNTTATVLLGIPLLLNCKSGTAITYAFAYASNAANAMNYNLHIVAERL